MSDGAVASSEWFDRFFDAYYRHRPVNATFIGVHDYDDRLPDYSESGAGDAVAGMQALLCDSALIDQAALTEIERMDLRVALGFLATQLWEFQSSHFQRGNPSLYVGEAIFGVFSLLLTDFAPLPQRLDSAAARLDAIPRLLSQARAQVRSAPRPWTERAIRECRGSLAFLDEGRFHLGNRPAAFDRAAERARAAFASFLHHLTTALLPTGHLAVAAGEGALALHLREAHFVTERPEDIAVRAEEELARADAALSRSVAGSCDDHGARGYDEVWREARDRALGAGIITWPDFPIRYVPRPAWATTAAPDLYFLYYRAPAAFNRPAVHEYLVPDEYPGGVAVKLNHVVHHGGIGHHVQNWHAYRATSRIGRIAAVDCASRIAMLAGGTMAEGWACYATDLMNEIGYLTPAEQRDELATRKRMCARAVVDIQLHSGRMSFDETALYYQSRGGMSPENARAEVTKNSMFPGGAVMYLLGQEAIHRLRQAVSARDGNAFSLARFHDRILSYGSLPVSLIAQAIAAETAGSTAGGPPQR